MGMSPDLCQRVVAEQPSEQEGGITSRLRGCGGNVQGGYRDPGWSWDNVKSPAHLEFVEYWEPVVSPAPETSDSARGSV